MNKTFENYWKDYINNMILNAEEDDERIAKLSKKDYEKLEKRVYEKVINIDEIWETIDFHISEVLYKELEKLEEK